MLFFYSNIKEEKNVAGQRDMTFEDLSSESEDDGFVSIGDLPVFSDLYDQPIDAATFLYAIIFHNSFPCFILFEIYFNNFVI